MEQLGWGGFFIPFIIEFKQEYCAGETKERVLQFQHNLNLDKPVYESVVALVTECFLICAADPG